jgi:HD-GYP domain-containing protein (c-di-GMP phosphodiesterase class II)
MLKTIHISELQIGMYVTQVVKQEGTFRVKSSGRILNPEAIQKLHDKGIIELEIDLAKSRLAETEEQTSPLDEVNAAGLTYSEQLAHALKVYDHAKTIHGQLMLRISKGKHANVEDVQQISKELVAKVFECDEAISILTLLSENDSYFLEHSINCAILIILFGRFLGYDEDLLEKLGAGALLMDIGMMKLPLLLTSKLDTFNETETKSMRKHIAHALSLISKVDSISQVSIDVIEQHHERLDGSGYPEGLQGHEINVYGRMAAIVDIYDSLTSQRPHRQAMKPSEALSYMAEHISGLDSDLVNQFILCVGANPVGSLVKLASDQLAVVMRLNRHQPLKPVVMIFYDLTTRQDIVKQFDLANSEDAIVSSVDPADFNLGLSQFLKQTLLAH